MLITVRTVLTPPERWRHMAHTDLTAFTAFCTAFTERTDMLVQKAAVEVVVVAVVEALSRELESPVEKTAEPVERGLLWFRDAKEMKALSGVTSSHFVRSYLHHMNCRAALHGYHSNIHFRTPNAESPQNFYCIFNDPQTGQC